MNLNSSDTLLIERALQAYIRECANELLCANDEDEEYFKVEIEEAKDLQNRLGVRE